MELPNLVIETTRRCQLQCAHCLRGGRQNKNASINTIWEFLDKANVTSIGTVTFTGGEPFLNTSAMQGFLEICKKRKIYVGNFYIATNGLIFEKDSEKCREGLHFLIDMYLYCSDNEISACEISADEFHRTVTKDNKLWALKFTNKKQYNYREYGVILEGRAIKNNLMGRTTHTYRVPKNWDEVSESDIYLNVEGGVVFDCDMSYIRQKKHQMKLDDATALLCKLEKEYDND